MCSKLCWCFPKEENLPPLCKIKVKRINCICCIGDVTLSNNQNTCSESKFDKTDGKKMKVKITSTWGIRIVQFFSKK